MIASAFDLTGSRILVTGAASGIGASASAICAGLGAEMILVDRQPCDPVVSGIKEQGGSAIAHRADVSVRAEIERLREDVGAVDALILSAAVSPFGEDWLAPDWDASFERVMNVNVRGVLNVARAFLSGMAARGQGRVVLVGSLAGRTGGLIAGPHYAASKGAVHALVKWLARHAAPRGILVNGVAPASIETPMMDGQPVDLARIPLGRMGRADEVGWPIAFLCSAAASYVCGVIIDVNGGVHMA